MKCTIDVVFTILLFIKSLINYSIIEDFDYDLDHQPILSK